MSGQSEPVPEAPPETPPEPPPPTGPRIGDVRRPGPAGPVVSTPGPVATSSSVGRIVHVSVESVGDREIIVKLADGRPGVIARADFGDEAIPSVGESVDAALLARDDPAKRVVLSRSWARQQQQWAIVEAAHQAGEPLTGTVARRVKGGLVVDLGVRAFLPASMIDEQAVDDPSTLIGTEVTVVVSEIDRAGDRVVVSRRDHLRRERRRRERDALGDLEVGKRVTGTIVAIVDYGIHLDLGGVRGMIHRSEMSWGRSDSKSARHRVGDELEVVVTELNKSKRRVGLSVRQLTPDPLGSLEVGSIVSATITKVIEYGAFARLNDGGVEGLVHMTELSDMPGSRPDQIVAPGDEVQVKITGVDLTKRRITLSVREALLS